jgi:hypothetical protein
MTWRNSCDIGSRKRDLDQDIILLPEPTMRARDWSVPRYLIAVIMLLNSLYVGADECSQSNSNGVSSSDELNISGIDSSTITTAIGYWSGGCPGYGTTFPSMTVGGSGGISVTVTHYSGTSTLTTGSCGHTMFSLQGPGNTVTSASIEIWDRQGNGIDCILSDTLAHELGHILGLADNPSSACIGRIMGGRPPGGTRSVSSSDCMVAGQKWLTSKDISPGGGVGGGCPPV